MISFNGELQDRRNELERIILELPRIEIPQVLRDQFPKGPLFLGDRASDVIDFLMKLVQERRQNHEIDDEMAGIDLNVFASRSFVYKNTISIVFQYSSQYRPGTVSSDIAVLLGADGRFAVIGELE